MIKIAVLVLVAIFLAGCVQPEVEKEDCSDCEAQLLSTKEFYANHIESMQDERDDLTITSESLWNDYWDCYVAFLCSQDIKQCKESFGASEENIAYANMSCLLAKNYVKYYQTFEEV